ncbi:MAG: HdeD family acid-resistance protein [Terracidiphilus sp.]
MSTLSFGAVAKESVGWSIVLSVLMILAGVLAIVVPPAAGIAVLAVVSWLLMLSGAAHLVFAWHTRTAGGMIWELLLGILYICVGVYVLLHPVAGLASLTLVLAIYLFAEGVLELIFGFRIRPMPGSGWLLFDGIVTLILGILIWRSWPSSTEWVIGTLVGISMLFSGTARLSLSLAARRVVSKVA